MKDIAKGFGMFLAFYVVTKIVVAPVANKVQSTVGLVNKTTGTPLVQL
ncbi:MAG TPA: hypothetical protein VK149_12545 [Sideroxyarcus sp.]|nr:hypothetical protein [Sideroxyarcus sp.]